MSQEHVAGTAGSIHIEDGGSGGTPVVFVHSFGGSKKHWSAQLAHVRAKRRAVALDLRGHGESSPPAGDNYAIEALATDIGAVVDALKIPRFILVGHSIGGAAAISYAGDHPDQVEGLLLVGTPGKIPREQSKAIMDSMVRNYDSVSVSYWEKLLKGAHPHVRELVLEGMRGMTKDASLRLIQSTFDFDPLIGLRRYHGPTKVVFTPHGNTPDDLQNRLPDIPNKVIVGTSHWIQLDNPEEFNRILDTFLARVDEGAHVGASTR